MYLIDLTITVLYVYVGQEDAKQEEVVQDYPATIQVYPIDVDNEAAQTERILLVLGYLSSLV